MGYDAHITRAESWGMGDEPLISPQEWLTVVRADQELQLLDEGKPYTAEWLPAAVNCDTYFEWENSAVHSKNPSPEALLKMEELARRLGARVQGDDGEIYENGKPVLG
jgi:hypothetical protein